MAKKAIAMEECRDLMSRQHNVRNMSVIAHVDHGKTTLTDSLLSKAGFISVEQAGGKRATDTREDEQIRGITIKSTAVSMYYEIGEEDLNEISSKQPIEGSAFLVNLIDSPGHVDFSSEVTAALRVTDGAMVVVDAASGVSVQTETVLRQAIGERIKPILMMNKMDRCILHKQMDKEELYQCLLNTVERCNSIVDTYTDESCPMGDLRMDPSKGNVGFGAGLHGWGFNLDQFARMLAKRQRKTGYQKLREKLWGEHYYNEETRKWNKTGGEGYVRGFNKFVLEPLYKLLKACTEGRSEEAIALAEKLQVPLTNEERELKEKQLMISIMKKWLPAGDAMLQMIVKHLPSPIQAQKYRTELLYEGPMDDEAAIGMKNCDPNGPVMMYVSKMIPSNDGSRFTAFGRLFSGTIKTGQTVRIMTPNYEPGKNTGLNVKSIPRTVVMMGDGIRRVDDVPCGNVCGLVGIDKYLIKTGTISTFEKAHNIKVLKFSVSPVVRVAVEAEEAAKLPKLIEGLARLAKSDPMVQISNENGQNIVAGAGELHIEICLKDLQDFAGVKIKQSDPAVSYRESVNAESPQPCLAKSSNKHNRVYMTAQPLHDKLTGDLDEGKIYPTQDVKTRSGYLVNDYNWDTTDARKIWCFGPEGKGPNLLVDVTKGNQSLGDMKDLIVAGFQWASQEGPLCEENMRGTRLNITDATVHSDPACRKGNQVIPAARRCVYASVLSASPILLEPVYLVDIQCPEAKIGSVYTVLNSRRGNVFEQMNVMGTPVFNLKAHLPVNESFGFNEDLRSESGGQAFPQCIFDHWQAVPGSPLDNTTKAGQIVLDIRKKKNLSDVVPQAEAYLDHL